MDDRKWIENVTKYRFVSWLLVVVILGAGVKVAASINYLAYGDQNIDPSSTYWFTLIIFFGGYSLWSSSIAANVVAKVLLSFFKALLKKLIRTRKLDDNDVKSVSKEVFSDENQNKILSDIRKGTRHFVSSGLLFGFILGLVHIISVEPSLGLQGLAIYVAYGLSWGWLWYKIAWYGFIPLPSGEEG